MTSHTWQFPEADRFMRAEMHRDGSYQGKHLHLALSFVADWNLAIDVGAHVGTWAKRLSEHFVRVIAIEPSDDTFACLQANMAGFECLNVHCRQVAVGAKSGSVTMALDAKERDRGNTGARYVRPGGVIPCETIDSWEIPTLGFLKIDAEGSELQVLQGALETIKAWTPIILFEAKGFGAKRYGEKTDAVPRLLGKIGYRELATVSADHIWGPG